ncbi:hypothetical protein [Dickeya fangzhongdai]|uniref:hypothetical protein n=1 Tax=Dickeya fangzhongdai TaxID=1778540 RepID=UPI0023E3DD12|nr:hypothetical protein [Dickeya fangzhongdai]WES88300.1 hypothetical protein PQ617_19090 [Dickeya fangzhongdai]
MAQKAFTTLITPGYESIQASLISAGFILGVEEINYVIPVDNRRQNIFRENGDANECDPLRGVEENRCGKSH